MPSRLKNKHLSSYVAMIDTKSDNDYHDGHCKINIEIRNLRNKILSEGSPGGAMLVRKMEGLDISLCDTFLSMNDFNPQHHHRSYQADPITRRYIYLKARYNLSILKYIADEIESRLANFHLTRANTQLPPEPDWLSAAKAWRRDYNRERAREARSDRAARKQTAARKVAAGASTSASTSPNSRSKASSSR